jgi:hypothetical protein
LSPQWVRHHGRIVAIRPVWTPTRSIPRWCDTEPAAAAPGLPEHCTCHSDLRDRTRDARRRRRPSSVIDAAGRVHGMDNCTWWTAASCRVRPRQSALTIYAWALRVASLIERRASAPARAIAAA